jgi:heme exporter protein D
VTAHDKMVWLAVASDTLAVCIVVAQLAPGLGETVERIQGLMRRVRRSRARTARHRLAEAPEADPADPDDGVADTRGEEVPA